MLRRLIAGPLLALVLVGASVVLVSAHGVVDWSRRDQIYTCGRSGSNIKLGFSPPLVSSNPVGWSYIAYNVYGQAGFGTPEVGWKGWQYFNGSPWFGGYTNGHPQYWSFGHSNWANHIELVVPSDNTTSFGNNWLVYMLVQWPDGHQTSHWQNFGEC